MQNISEDISIENTPAEKYSFGKTIFSGFTKFILVLCIWIFLNLFIFSAYVVGESMENTLKDGDFLLGIRSRFTDVESGDIVTAKRDGYLVVKRVVGVAGDHIEINSDGVFVNGQLFDVLNQGSSDTIYGSWDISEGHVFVLGDNREHSIDSRKYGELSENDIVGKMVFRYYPFSSIGGVK